MAPEVPPMIKSLIILEVELPLEEGEGEDPCDILRNKSNQQTISGDKKCNILIFYFTLRGTDQNSHLSLSTNFPPFLSSPALFYHFLSFFIFFKIHSLLCFHHTI